MPLLGRIRQTLTGWFSRHQVGVFLVSITLAFLLVYFFDRIFVVIPAGHRGVLFRVFFGGTVVNRSYPEGLKLNLPWNQVEIYDVRRQIVRIPIQALSRDGLVVSINTSSRVFPIIEHLGELHKKFGPDYIDKLVRPIIESSVREVVGKYRYPELYANDAAQAFQDEVGAEIKREFANLPVALAEFFSEHMALPETINTAIEEKLTQQERLLTYEFRLRAAQMEITRLRLEAEATAAFNNTIKRSLNEDLLRYLGIKATESLAKSPNTKVLMFGNRDGLPVILNLEDGKSSPAPALSPQAQGPERQSPSKAAGQDKDQGGTTPAPAPQKPAATVPDQGAAGQTDKEFDSGAVINDKLKEQLRELRLFLEKGRQPSSPLDKQ